VKLTKNDEPFVWGDEQQKAFEEVKTRLTQMPILCHYDPELPIELHTDAC